MDPDESEMLQPPEDFYGFDGMTATRPRLKLERRQATSTVICRMSNKQKYKLFFKRTAVPKRPRDEDDFAATAAATATAATAASMVRACMPSMAIFV